MGKKGSQTTTTETAPWKPAQGALENILANAGQLFDQQGGINAEWLDKEIADLNPALQDALKNMVNSQGFKDLAGNIGNLTQQGASGLGSATGMLGGLAQQGITSEKITEMAKDLYDSELVGSQKEQLTKDVQEGLNKNIQGLNQQSAASGNMGSSRAGVAEGVAVGKAGEAIATGSAAIENAARQSAMTQAIGTLQGNQNTALGAAGALGQLGLGSINAQAGLGNMYQQMLGNQLQAGMIGQNQAQNILNNKWFNQQGQQNIGWDMLNKYANIAGGIGSMGGTTTQTGKGPDRFGQILGAGATLGGLWLGSDRRIKDHIVEVKPSMEKTLEDGSVISMPTLYQWVWNEKAEAFFEEQGFKAVPPTCGAIAQELEETGFGRFVEEVPTKVEGLDGSIKLVNYVALIAYGKEHGFIDEEMEA